MSPYLYAGLTNSSRIYYRLYRKVAKPTLAEDIKNLVCNQFDISVEMVESKSREGAAVEARHIAIYLIRKHAKIGLTQLGKMFGNRTHSTMITSISAVGDRIDTDKVFKDNLDRIEGLLTLIIV